MTAVEAPPRPLNPPWLRRAARHRGAWLGALLLSALIALAAGAPRWTDVDPIAVDPASALQPPGPAHPFGTDNLGRDVWARFLFGGQVSLQVGVAAIAVGSLLGSTLGMVSAYYGGRVDALISWAVEVLQAFPGILLALAVVAILGPGLLNVMIAVGVGTIPSFMRLARGAVFVVRGKEYVEAARALGGSDAWILWRHILPNILRPLLVLATLGIGGAILEGAALNFLGLGAQPPAAEWGAMLSAGRGFLRQAWWMTAFPGLGIFGAVLAINLLGDALGDVLNPEQRAG